ncbi:MAG: ATP-binding protein [Pedobacter sp.]
MNTFPILIKLSIENDPEKIFENTNNVISKIIEHVSLDLGYQRRIRLILIELITNSIKHSSEGFTLIQLVIDQPHLSIQKIEKGIKIAFSDSSPQLPFEDVDNILNISFSESNKHNIQPLGQYKFEFLKPKQEENPDINQIPEHFGLYIITMAADSFVYEYDPELGENTYIVHLNF